MKKVITILENTILDLDADIDWFRFQLKSLPSPEYIELEQSLHCAIATAENRISLIRTAIMHLQAAV